MPAGVPSFPLRADWLSLSCRPQALLLLCEFIINSTRAPPSEDALYHTLLQLYLADEAELKSQHEPGPTASQQARRFVSRFRPLQVLQSHMIDLPSCRVSAELFANRQNLLQRDVFGELHILAIRVEDLVS